MNLSNSLANPKIDETMILQTSYSSAKFGHELILQNQNGEAKFDSLHVDHIQLPKKIEEPDQK